MAIIETSEAKRRAALRVWGVLPPADGTIDDRDRAATVREYLITQEEGDATGLVVQTEVSIYEVCEVVAY